MVMSDTPTFVDYSNYTEFPLQSPEYEHMCWLLNQKPMSHSGYWIPMPGMDIDIPRSRQQIQDAQRTSVCSSSVTYLLDGTVGLAWHLALIAQLAGLAKEASSAV